MKTRRWVSALIVALLLLAAVGVLAAGAARDRFVGRWTSTDAVDGSSQTLTIGGGGSGDYRLTLYDADATVACPGPSRPIAARARGTGSVSGDVLSGSWVVSCLESPIRQLEGTYQFEFTYDGGELQDTVMIGGDSFTTNWTRR